MPLPVYSCDKRIDCDTSLLSNYSSEGAEPFPPYFAVVFPNPQHPLDKEWSNEGCLYICTSYISQEDADLCALRQSILCTNPPGEEIWYSAPASCSATCPEGGEFTYNVPAGMFVAHTYAEALAQAQAYACSKAQESRICIGGLPRCACLGSQYTAVVTLTVPNIGVSFGLSGSLPPGLEFIQGTNAAVITGTPTVNGTYAFNIVASDVNGNYAIRTFVIQVLEITTTALPDFVTGTPYLFQMQAAGGSGNYIWSIASGTLPDGLSMSAVGIISGTPTAPDSQLVTFRVTDVTCPS